MKSIIAPLLLAAIVADCSSSVTPDAQAPLPDVPARPLSRAESSIVEADNTFGLKLLGSLNASSNPDSNLFISPLSVSMALGMTLNGAAGPTRDSMEKTLELAGLTPAEINEAYRDLRDLLTGLDRTVKFSIANSIWYRQGLQVEPEFINSNRDYFGAVTSALDFRSPDAATRINQWVNDNTAGKITEIVANPISDELVMFLINAIYFKGTWTAKFDPKLTQDAPFTHRDGSSNMVKMMYQKNAKLRLYGDDQVQMVELPYGNGKYSMVIMMPGRHQTLDHLLSSLDVSTWQSLMGKLHEDEGEIYLPRFTITWEDALGATLKKMGMGVAFSDDADFTKIDRHGGLYISEVRHKTFVEVNEEGTEAAAVTSVEIGNRSAGGFTLRADRPFLFAIRERHSGTILFAGKVMKP